MSVTTIVHHLSVDLLTYSVDYYWAALGVRAVRQSRVDGSMGQMGHENGMGHMGHGSLGDDP